MSPRNRNALIALALSMATVSMGVGFIVPLLSIYAGSLGGGGIWMGLIFAANPGVRALFMPLVGHLADVRGKKMYLLIGLSGYVLVAILMGCATHSWHLFALRVSQGVFSAMVMPVSRAYAGVLSPKGKEGTVMGWFNLAFFLGFSLGPLLGGILSDAFGLRVPFFIKGANALIALLMVSLLVPDQVPAQGAAERPRYRFADAIHNPIIAGLGLARALNAMGRGLFVSLLPLYASTNLGMSGTQIGTVAFTFAFLSSSMQPITGRLADILNRKRMAIVGFVLTPLTLLLLPQTTSFGWIMVLALLMGFGPGIFVPASLAIAVTEGRKHGMGTTMGLVEMAMSIGMAAGSIVGGTIAEYAGVTMSFYVVACIVLLGLVPVLWLVRDRNEGAAVAAGD